MEEYKHKEITRKIIGCAMEVHSFLGNGFQEVIYQRALALEFQDNGIDYARELGILIHYKRHPEPIGKRRVDFLVEKCVLVELKAITELDKSHFAQMINYLKAYQLEVGLLINFGENSLRFKRFVKTLDYSLNRR
ncbi:MAG: GxxExxY protein [Desulfobacterales bacterium]|nr:GxxExxY protein [Desulfobacterales bacterium]